MKFSENWLREFVDPKVSTAELAEQFTMAGLEVDSVAPAATTLSQVVVGEILEVNPHPDADKLVVCRVAGGDGEQQVVCGAPNARPGLKAPFALPGAKLGDVSISKVKLRGVESHGMLCSERELGMGEAHDGLLELSPDAPVGEALADYLALNDSIISLDLTPNRGDCLSIVGLAREAGALNSVATKAMTVAETPAVSDQTFAVELVKGAGCPRFVGRVIRGVNLQAASPLWLKERLRRAGVRSIDPVVDVTNYVMLELGQPLHAYDHARLSGKITVRKSSAGEKLTLLDGNEIELREGTLLITDESGPIGMAGIMGGLSTAVNENTVDIYLEGAFFEPLAIAGQARGYGMATDASHRFERGVDPEGQVRAVERATSLLLELAGGEPGPVVETVLEAELPQARTVPLRAARISLLLGIEVPAPRVGEILAQLGFDATETQIDGEAGWQVSVPSYRFDIAIEADLIEEVSRIHGYGNLPVRLPATSVAMAHLPESRLTIDRVKDQLVSRGYFEAITYSFVDAARLAELTPAQEPIALANPLSAEMSVMRTTLWAGLLDSLLHNVNRQQQRVRLFEVGLAFTRTANKAELTLDDISQERMLAGVAYGSRQAENWANDAHSIDFHDVKGDLESLFSLTGDTREFEFVPGHHSALHPGQCAEIMRDGQMVGVVGQLDPGIRARLGLRAPVYLFELKADALLPRRLAASRPLPRVPGVRRDLALVVSRDTTGGQVRRCIEQAADDTLEDIRLFDLYEGEGIDAGKKSLALGLTFQHPSRTLTDEEINEAVANLVAALETGLSAKLRDQG